MTCQNAMSEDNEPVRILKNFPTKNSILSIKNGNCKNACSWVAQSFDKSRMTWHIHIHFVSLPWIFIARLNV